MRILITCDRYPAQPLDGLTLRVVNYLRELSPRHRFDLLCLADPDATANPAVDDRLGELVRLPPATRPAPARTVVERVRDGFDIDQLYFESPEVTQAITTQCQRHRYDLVWDAGCNMLLNLQPVRAHIPLLADQVDDAVLPLQRRLARATAPYERLWLHKQIWLQKRFARRYIANAGAVLFVSSVDEASFRSFCPQARTAVIANGVDSTYFNAAAAPAGGAGLQLVFEGVMSFEPNVEAACHLVADILPAVWRTDPEARLFLVGRDPAPAVQALRGPRVEVTGFVDDVRPFLARSRIFVCPMRTGAGIKNKILQAWAMGMAVVSTAEGAHGLPARDGENLLLRQQPDEFAQAVLQLAGDAALRERLGDAGRRCVEQGFSWGAKAAELEALFTEVAAGRGATSGPGARA